MGQIEIAVVVKQLKLYENPFLSWFSATANIFT